MNLDMWQIWVIVAIILCIVEVFAPTFLALCFGIGCLLSALASVFTSSIIIQVSVFCIGTLICLFTVRPFFLKYLHKKSDSVKTNAEALIGKIGRVTEIVDNEKNTGRAIVEGDDWRVMTANDEIINENEKVEVVKIDSTTLIVKPITKN
jgi:membrane protein implicated in regulation of membrane protease activity